MSDLVKTSANRMVPLEEQPPAAAIQELPQESLLAVLWRRRWTVAVCTILAIACGFIYVFTATPIFTSTSRIYVEQAGPKILSDALGSPRQSDSYLYTQAELLRSTPILSAAVDALGAQRVGTLGEMDNPVGYLKKAISVSVGKKDDLLTVSIDSPHADEAARIVNAVVESYISYHTSQKRSTASEVLRILTKEKEKRDQELAEKTQALLEFKQQNSALSFQSDRGNILLQRLARLSEALTEAQLKAAEAKAAMEASSALVQDPAKLRELIDAERASKAFSSLARSDQDLRQQLSRMLVQESLVRQIYGPEHRTAIQLRTSINETRDAIEAGDVAFAKAYLASSQQSYEIARSRERDIQQAFDAAQQEAMQLNTQASAYSRLETEVKRIEKMCDILDSRIKELNVTEDVGALNISIMEVAQRGSLSKPQKSRSIAMAMVLGIMAGVGLALVRDWTDQRLRSAEEVQAILGVPVLGVVPHMAGQNMSERGQMVAAEPHSDVAEAYRTIRTTLYFGLGGANVRTILVTSPESGDGKTTLASNLAIAMAQAGQKVLLLDCDFRKPSQAELFGIDLDLGIGALLSGKATAEAAVRPTSVSGLDLLGTGKVPSNPSEILNSAAFANMLKEFGDRYDRIIIDSPPVLPVTDARILGAMCDTTLLVIRAEKSSRHSARLGMDGLLSVGARVLGAVVNDIPRRRDRYGYGYGYGYGHQYGTYGNARLGTAERLDVQPQSTARSA